MKPLLYKAGQPFSDHWRQALDGKFMCCFVEFRPHLREDRIEPFQGFAVIFYNVGSLFASAHEFRD